VALRGHLRRRSSLRAQPSSHNSRTVQPSVLNAARPAHLRNSGVACGVRELSKAFRTTLPTLRRQALPIQATENTTPFEPITTSLVRSSPPANLPARPGTAHLSNPRVRFTPLTCLPRRLDSVHHPVRHLPFSTVDLHINHFGRFWHGSTLLPCSSPTKPGTRSRTTTADTQPPNDLVTGLPSTTKAWEVLAHGQ